MTIGLYYNKSDKRRLNKELETIATYNGYMKNESSILEPIIYIEGAFNIGNNINANYLYLPDYRRYYYITDIIQVRANLVQIMATVDPLMSFKDELKECSGIVRRGQNVKNMYLDDGSFKIYQNKKLLTQPFDSGFTTENFILTMAGG